MARLIPLLLALAVFLVWLIARQQADRPRSDRTFRPRANPRDRGAAAPSTWADGEADPRGEWVVARSELSGLRDAYSSAELDVSKPLYRCVGCQACYHRSSLDALRAQNFGRCTLCGSQDLRAVQVR